jgi:hypothetical protein
VAAAAAAGAAAGGKQSPGQSLSPINIEKDEIIIAIISKKEDHSY